MPNCDAAFYRVIICLASCLVCLCLGILSVTSGGIGVPEPLGNIKEVIEHVTAGRDLISAIAEKRPPLCSANDARVTLEMVMGIFESHRLGGARVELPLKSRDNPITRW